MWWNTFKIASVHVCFLLLNSQKKKLFFSPQNSSNFTKNSCFLLSSDLFPTPVELFLEQEKTILWIKKNFLTFFLRLNNWSSFEVFPFVGRCRFSFLLNCRTVLRLTMSEYLRRAAGGGRGSKKKKEKLNLKSWNQLVSACPAGVFRPLH